MHPNDPDAPEPIRCGECDAPHDQRHAPWCTEGLRETVERAGRTLLDSCGLHAVADFRASVDHRGYLTVRWRRAELRQAGARSWVATVGEDAGFAVDPREALRAAGYPVPERETYADDGEEVIPW